MSRDGGDKHASDIVLAGMWEAPSTLVWADEPDPDDAVPWCMRLNGISKLERVVHGLNGQVAALVKENVERATGVTALGACVVRVVSVKPSARMKHAAEGVVHDGGYGDWEGKAPRGTRGS